MNDFLLGYIEAALWASNAKDDTTGKEYESLESFALEDLDSDSLERMKADCEKFQEKNKKLLQELDEVEAGRDFFFTRCGHGVGYWDRGLGEIGKKLTAACEGWGSIYFWVENGKVFCENG